jgi:uncharacterized membrane protein required for colicin V production
MNWIDLAIAGVVCVGALTGARGGIIRQTGLMAGFYVSLVLAARYYGQAAGFVVTHVPAADRSVASAYALAGMTAGGTLGIGWLSRVVYASTGLPRVARLDRLAGAGLGAAWSWAVLAFAATVLLYGISFSWGASEPLRHDIDAQIEASRLIGMVRLTMPALRDLLTPWLPGGLPAPLSV